MRRSHLLLAAVVAVVWGVNFTIVDVGLRHFPPLLFAALRFVAVALPAVFFVRRPGVGARWVVAVGLFLGVGQFGLLFTGISRGMSAGLASLVLQAQAVFTLVFGAAILRERPARRQLAGVAIATAGMVVIAVARGASTPLGPLLMVLGAAASWGIANIFIRLARPRSGLSLMVWASLVPPLPLAALSLLVEGPAADQQALARFSLAGAAALGYLVIFATLIGYGIWNFLLGQYPAATVAPASLLVPVVGIATAWAFLREQPRPGELLGAAVVLAGLAVVSGVVPRRRGGRSVPSDPGALASGEAAPLPQTPPPRRGEAAYVCVIDVYSSDGYDDDTGGGRSPRPARLPGRGARPEPRR